MTFDENPRFLDWAVGYRVARAALAQLTGASSGELDAWFRELGPLHAEMRRTAGALPAAGALMQAPILYVLLRALRPGEVVETGLSSGYSARLLLEALHRNGEGRLTSVGLPQFGVSPGSREAREALSAKSVGWLVPEPLRTRWSVRLGPSETELGAALAAAGRVDLFLHDSLHQYPTMTREYREAWGVLRPGGVLASHDIHNNAAWPDFLREHGLRGDVELDHDLGAVRRPRPG